MKRAIIIIGLVMLVSSVTWSAVNSGIYFSFYNSVNSTFYKNNEYSTPAQEYSSGMFNIFASIYSENAFEISLSVSSDKYFNESTSESDSRLQIALEIGKLVSFPLPWGEKSIVSPDVSFGLFGRANSLGPAGNQEIFFEVGFYAGAKLRVKLSGKNSFFKSLDIGYKFTCPFLFSFYQDMDHKVMTSAHAIYAGISF